MPAPIAPSGDAIQAAINVSVARSRRLVSSWLPPPTPEEIASQKTEEELAKEDAELFKPMPPRLGLGAPIPKDFLENTDPKARRQAISINDHLKRKIMGKTKSSNKQGASKPRPRTGNDQSNPKNDDDEEEEGRSSLGKPKRRKIIAEKKKGADENGVANKAESSLNSSKKMDVKDGERGGKSHTSSSFPSPTHEETTKTSSKGLARVGAYFDVHRAEKAKKKKKKKKTTN